jgi:hypothetical protein
MAARPDPLVLRVVDARRAGSRALRVFADLLVADYPADQTFTPAQMRDLLWGVAAELDDRVLDVEDDEEVIRDG